MRIYPSSFPNLGLKDFSEAHAPERLKQNGAMERMDLLLPVCHGSYTHAAGALISWNSLLIPASLTSQAYSKIELAQ